MIARKYDKRIQLFSLDSVNDVFGGFTVENVFRGNKWAHIETKNSVRNTDNGNIENYQTIMISFRARGLDLDVKKNFIVYNAKKYVINKIDNVDLTGIDLTAFCTESDG